MLNLKYYNNKDDYLDGGEAELKSIFLRKIDPLTVLGDSHRWEFLYHLSRERRNLLEFFSFRKEQSLLELGAGCGALTGLFCEKLGKVTAVELSRIRAEIIELRHSFHSNLEIFVGNYLDMVFPDRFDNISLIGVLEYTRSFGRGVDPYETLFSKIKRDLTSEGTLIIAIENKFGLKYWAGASEDHTGRLFDSIEGNYILEKKVETFSRSELVLMLRGFDFEIEMFYYPYPDYKFPSIVFSDDFLPQIEFSFAASPNYDRDRFVLFDESRAFRNICASGLFPFFANSFLVIARKKKGSL